MKTKADLYEAWAKVLRMCGDADPCFKLTGAANNLFTITENVQPGFSLEPSLYIFPIAYVKKKPVFVGDFLYDCYGHEMQIFEIRNAERFAENYNWEPPKSKTFGY
jgi:hypothetical protein